MSVLVGLEKALGNAIQEARKKAGMTQQELCNKTGISYSTLAKIERGAIKSPSVFTVTAIAKTTGVRVEDLTGEALPKAEQKQYQRAKNGIEFVYFDINGCLVRFFQRAFTKMAEDTGHRPEVIENLFWHYNDAVCRGEMSLVDFNSLLAERLGVQDLDWADYYLNGVEVIKEAQEALEWASERFRVGLLSNIMPGLIDKMFERGILPKIDYQVIIDSSKEGAIKPEAQIYQIAAEKANARAEDILLIDDSRPNLMAAQHMGWHVLWFDDYRPEESAKSIKEILAI
jgi:FMN phosphatase YigB (HAD superfamily)/DNA-binding XRE family transcriptional regulator